MRHAAGSDGDGGTEAAVIAPWKYATEHERDIMNHLYMAFHLDYDTARDVTQEVFWRAHKCKTRIRGNAKAWLRRVTHNAAVDFLKKEVHHTRLDLLRESELPQCTQEFSASASGGESLVLCALSELAAQRRAAFLCRACLQLDYPEIAVLLGIEESTVRVTFRNACKILQSHDLVRLCADLPQLNSMAHEGGRADAAMMATIPARGIIEAKCAAITAEIEDLAHRAQGHGFAVA